MSPHAKHGRLAHFGHEVVRPASIAVPLVVLVLLLLSEGTVLDAILAALVAYAVVAVLAFIRAVRGAREAFFESYAGSRGLERHADEVPPPVTPLLRMGDRRWAARVMTGSLPGGLDGALAQYTYEELSDKGGRRGDPHRFTIAIYGLPDVTDRVLELYCEPRSGSSPGGITGFRRRNRLRLESVALDRRYEIFYGTGEDENWLHQLHSPTFIVWLSEQPPEGFGFQLSHGYLCAFLPGHRESAAELDALCEAGSLVARRVFEEAAE